MRKLIQSWRHFSAGAKTYSSHFQTTSRTHAIARAPKLQLLQQQKTHNHLQELQLHNISYHTHCMWCTCLTHHPFHTELCVFDQQHLQQRCHTTSEQRRSTGTSHETHLHSTKQHPLMYEPNGRQQPESACEQRCEEKSDIVHHSHPSERDTTDGDESTCPPEDSSERSQTLSSSTQHSPDTSTTPPEQSLTSTQYHRGLPSTREWEKHTDAHQSTSEGK